MQRNVPVDLFCAVRSVDLRETSVIALCDGHSAASAGIIVRRAELTFPNPLFQGLADQIDVIVRASDGSTGKDLITVYYQSGNQKSLELEVFLEREKNLKLEVERLGKSQAEIQQETDRSQED